MKEFVELAKIMRPQNAVMAVFSYVIAYLLGPYQAVITDGFYYGILTIVLMSIFATIQNDISDYNIDIANNRQNALHGKGAIFSKNYLVNLNRVILLLSVFCLYKTGITLAVVVVYCCTFALVYMYNMQPFWLSRRPILSILTLGLCMSALPAVFGFVVAGRSNIIIMILSVVSLFLQRCSLSILKDYKDIKGDTKYGKNTFLVAYGPSTVKKVSITLGFLGYGLMLATIALHEYSMPIMLVIVTILLSLLVYRSMAIRLLLKPSNDHKYNNNIFTKSLIANNIFEIGVIACLFIWQII